MEYNGLSRRVREGRIDVLIADSAPTRLGIRMALGDEMDVCAEAGDAEQAIRAAKREQPGVCLVGRSIVGDGIRAVRGICRAAPNAAAIVLADHYDADDLLDAIRAGAIGYIPAPGLDPPTLRRIVRAAAANEAVVPRVMVRELLMELRNHGHSADALTPREGEVLGMLRRGHSTAAIAAGLGLSPITVRRHISTLVYKLGVKDRAALVGLPAGTPRRGKSHPPQSGVSNEPQINPSFRAPVTSST